MTQPFDLTCLAHGMQPPTRTGRNLHAAQARKETSIISKRLLLYAPEVTSQTDVKPRAD